MKKNEFVELSDVMKNLLSMSLEGQNSFSTFFGPPLPPNMRSLAWRAQNVVPINICLCVCVGAHKKKIPLHCRRTHTHTHHMHAHTHIDGDVSEFVETMELTLVLRLLSSDVSFVAAVVGCCCCWLWLWLLWLLLLLVGCCCVCVCVCFCC